MKREYLVKASSLHATYTAGRFCATSPEEATDMAQTAYCNSSLGRALKDTGAFRFWVSSDENE